MSIRISAKAVVLRSGHVLLNENKGKTGNTYYTFPGGGQEPGETLREAVKREVLEETGYTVTVGDFLSLYEEISGDPAFRRDYPDYFHISYHLFRCTLDGDAQATPVQMDASQLGCKWVPLSDVPTLPLFPAPIRDALPALLAGGAPQYLGSVNNP